jgi:hypothetical protein
VLDCILERLFYYIIDPGIVEKRTAGWDGAQPAVRFLKINIKFGATWGFAPGCPKFYELPIPCGFQKNRK